ncbi:hypothetical protein XENOCAPTIV_026414, partial [Xenoophorus captivus]
RLVQILKGEPKEKFPGSCKSCSPLDLGLRMLSLIQKNLPAATEMPLLLMSWLALIPFDDLPEFSELTGVSVEHLIQSLLYRLRTCGEKMDLKKDQENVKAADEDKVLVCCLDSSSAALSKSHNVVQS